MKISQLLTEPVSEADNLDCLSDRDAEGESDDEMEDQTIVHRQLPSPEPETKADTFRGPPSSHEAHGIGHGVLDLITDSPLSTAPNSSISTAPNCPVSTAPPSSCLTAPPTLAFPTSSLPTPVTQAVRGPLDQPWNYQSWRSKSSKKKLVALLAEAGKDPNQFKEMTASEVIYYVIRRRKRREASGMFDLLRSVKSEPNTTKAVDNTTHGKAVAPGINEMKAISLSTARAYLLAIERQYYLDVSNQKWGNKYDLSDPTSIFYTRNTILQDDSGVALLSNYIELLVREVIQRRDDARRWSGNQSSTVANEKNLEQDKMKQALRKCTQKLATALLGCLRSKEVDSVVKAKQIVDQVFGIGGVAAEVMDDDKMKIK
jgi:hypothetical protein